METNTLTAIPSVVKEPRRLIERSASYPGLTLQEAEQFALLVAKSFVATQVINRGDIAAVLKSAEATIQRDIAAAAQFCLFSKSKEGYQISSLLKQISNPLNDAELKKLRLESFKSPKLFAELIEKFDGHVLPVELKTHLIRFHKIAEKAAPIVAEIFIKSAEYCGALNELGFLNYSHAVQSISVLENYAPLPNLKIEEHPPVVQPAGIGKPAEVYTPAGKGEHSQLLLNEMNNKQEVKVNLTGGKFAVIHYPSDLTKKDIEVLRKQLELLELLIE